MKERLKIEKLILTVNEWMFLSLALVIMLNVYGVIHIFKSAAWESMSVMGIPLMTSIQGFVLILYKFVFLKLREYRNSIKKNIQQIQQQISNEGN